MLSRGPNAHVPVVERAAGFRFPKNSSSENRLRRRIFWAGRLHRIVSGALGLQNDARVPRLGFDCSRYCLALGLALCLALCLARAWPASTARVRIESVRQHERSQHFRHDRGRAV